MKGQVRERLPLFILLSKNIAVMYWLWYHLTTSIKDLFFKQ